MVGFLNFITFLLSFVWIIAIPPALKLPIPEWQIFPIYFMPLVITPILLVVSFKSEDLAAKTMMVGLTAFSVYYCFWPVIQRFYF